MTSPPSTGQAQPSLRVLQRKSSNIARQTAASRSASAYSVPAVGSKVHKDPASVSAAPASVSPTMADTAGNVHLSPQTQPASDTAANKSLAEDGYAALAASIPGQVDSQEHRCDLPHFLLRAAIASPLLASKQQIKHQDMH